MIEDKSNLVNITYPYLFKAFREEEYALDFINNGHFFMGNLKYYASLEKDDSKSDAKEGRAEYKTKEVVQSINVITGENTFAPGTVNNTTMLIQPTFLLCTANPNVNLEFLRDRHGRYLVKIESPKYLIDMIDEFCSQKSKGCVYAGDVLYNKGEVFEKKDTSVKLAIFQKPKEYYAKECEFRIAYHYFDLQLENEDKLEVTLNSEIEAKII